MVFHHACFILSVSADSLLVSSSTRWEDLLERWREHIRDDDYDGDKIPRACVQAILKYARLTPSGKNFWHYEILRKLGKHILQVNWFPNAGDNADDKARATAEQDSLVNQLLRGLQNIRRPEYRAYFGCRCSEEEKRECQCEMLGSVPERRKRLGQEIEKMLGISFKNRQHECQINFIVALVKSERYTPAEMHAIIRVSLSKFLLRAPSHLHRILTRSLSRISSIPPVRNGRGRHLRASN